MADRLPLEMIREKSIPIPISMVGIKGKGKSKSKEQGIR